MRGRSLLDLGDCLTSGRDAEGREHVHQPFRQDDAEGLEQADKGDDERDEVSLFSFQHANHGSGLSVVRLKVTAKSVVPSEVRGRLFAQYEGRKYGRLTVVRTWRSTPHTYAECVCDCGQKWTGRTYNLQRGTSKSCGCLVAEVSTARLKALAKHGLTETKEHATWCRMRSRCNSQSNPSYKDYGGRGIKIAERWNDFENFLADMGKAPSPGASIDRIDNNKGYEPGNCRWTDTRTQNRNYRRNVMLTIDGETKCVMDWAADAGISHNTIRLRLKAGRSARDAVFAPLWSR